MKVVKLKPVMLKQNEVFIRPPEFLECDDLGQEKWKNSLIVMSSTLKEHFAQKKLRKEKNSATHDAESDAEAVKNLSQWKRTAISASPLLRKYTFKRQLTNSSQASESKQKLRSISHTVTRVPSRRHTNFTFYSQVLSIVAAERMKKLKNEEQFFRICQTNIDAENEINNSIERVNSEINEFKVSMRHLDETVENLKDQIRSREKEHEENVKKLKNYETMEYLALTKASDGAEEGKLLIFKEKMRKSKRELHKKYLEDIEDLKLTLASAERKLENFDFDRQKCKKQLKDYKEEISNLYFRILKEGKDLRADGLRWIVKALWKNGAFVPISTFPKFIDEENLTFIVQVAEKDLEVELLIYKIEQMRKEAKNRRTNSSISSSRELYQSVKNRLRDMSRSVISNSIDIQTLKENKVNEKNTNCYSEIGIMREKINKLNEWIKDSTEAEIKRTTENYKIAPGEAEKVGLYHLIKCLVGEKVREFNKYTRSQKAQPKGLFEIKG